MGTIGRRSLIDQNARQIAGAICELHGKPNLSSYCGMMDDFRSIDPADGAVIWQGPAASAAAISNSLTQAQEALPAWSATVLEVRIAQVRKFAAVMDSQKQSLAELIASETGKPLWEAHGEVSSAIAKVETSIAAQARRAGTKSTQTDFGTAVLRHQPHGVMAVLGPYNFPCHLPNGHIVPALLAGNTIVFKPSELTPATGQKMVELWHESGLQRNVLQIVQGGRETGSALLAQDIDGVLFTGSASTGAVLRRQFAERPKVILALELGGNNPLVVWDGDIHAAASLIVLSAFISAGQRCSCARRLILPKGDFGDAVVAATRALTQALIIGAWDQKPEPFMGPLVSDEAARRTHRAIESLIASGARPVLRSGPIAGRTDAFIQPCLLDVTGIETPDEEIFGPVLQIVRVKDFDAAIAVANATRFGLAAGLVSENDELWQRFLRNIRAGVVNRNRPLTGASGGMPFGGLGDSGNHRPSAFYAADYCAYPVASLEAERLQAGVPLPGMPRA